MRAEANVVMRAEVIEQDLEEKLEVAMKVVYLELVMMAKARVVMKVETRA